MTYCRLLAIVHARREYALKMRQIFLSWLIRSCDYGMFMFHMWLLYLSMQDK